MGGLAVACLNCGAPHQEGEVLCERCADSLNQVLVTNEPQKNANSAKTMVLNVRQTLFTLVVGILPIAGLVACLLWGYGPHMRPARRSLALALLWVHGVLLASVIVLLGAWIMSMANYPFYM